MTKLDLVFERVKHLSEEDQDFIVDWLSTIGDTDEVYELSDKEIAELKRRQVMTEKIYSMEEVFGTL